METRVEIARRPPDRLFTLATDAWTKPFWDAAAAHRLVAPRCGECGAFRMPPTPFCPGCRSQRITWVTLSGEGVIYSYSIVRRGFLPDMQDSLPYVTAVVQLPDADNVRLITNIVDTAVSLIGIDGRVRVVFDDLDGGVTIPRFKLAEDHE